MITCKLIVKHQTIVSVTEASSKIASTLCQKYLTVFCQKLKIVYCSNKKVLFTFHQHVLQILLKIMWEELTTSNISISNGNIKYPTKKLIFAVNLPSELFLTTTVTNADTVIENWTKIEWFKLQWNFELYGKNPGLYKQ